MSRGLRSQPSQLPAARMRRARMQGSPGPSFMPVQLRSIRASSARCRFVRHPRSGLVSMPRSSAARAPPREGSRSRSERPSPGSAVTSRARPGRRRARECRVPRAVGAEKRAGMLDFLGNFRRRDPLVRRCLKKDRVDNSPSALVGNGSAPGLVSPVLTSDWPDPATISAHAAVST
jgi:hypothetical protein